MRKKQSTNFIILSLQRHKPLYPQNISLKKQKQNSFLMTIRTDRSNKKSYREQTKGEGEEGAAKCEGRQEILTIDRQRQHKGFCKK